jgi:superfamily II DNA/RNA helicase
LRPLPPELPAPLLAALKKSGISDLYSHQSEAWEAVQRGENIVLATGTASGKTLAYNLPVLAALTQNPLARALYLFPTKALAQDQFSVSNQYSVCNQDSIQYPVGSTQCQRRFMTGIRRRPSARLSARRRALS